MAFSNAAKAGTALFLGGVEFSIGMILAEVYYPAYDVSTNYISDLGATCRSNVCTIHQPSATIFNGSAVFFGILVFVAAYYLQQAFNWRPLPIVAFLGGIGLVGVGIFPETTGSVHDLVSVIAFLFSGLSALLAYKVVKPPLSYLSVLLGLVTLVSMVLYIADVYLGLGPGGMERVVVYPVLLWVIVPPPLTAG